MLQTPSQEHSGSYPSLLFSTACCWRDPTVSHRQPGALLTFLPQNFSFDFGISHHLSDFLSWLWSALSVQSTGSCRRWVIFTCVSTCSHAKSCCMQYSWCGVNALSLLIQDKQPEFMWKILHDMKVCFLQSSAIPHLGLHYCIRAHTSCWEVW